MLHPGHRLLLPKPQYCTDDTLLKDSGSTKTSRPFVQLNSNMRICLGHTAGFDANVKQLSAACWPAARQVSQRARHAVTFSCSTVYTEFGPRAAWMLPIAVTSLSIALWITCYQRLAPCESRTSKYRQDIPPNGAIHSQDSK